MPESQASIGYGSRFAMATVADPAVFEDLAEVTDITPPSDSVDMVDVTHMASPNRTREFVAGLNDPGEASFEMNFVPGSPSDERLRAAKDAGERTQCRITFPNNVTWTFSGIVSGYEPTIPTEDKMTASVTFKVTGSTVTGVAA